MTKSYFRRADGVIVMFDLSSEESFLNVKGWMENIEVFNTSFDLLQNPGNSHECTSNIY